MAHRTVLSHRAADRTRFRRLALATIGVITLTASTAHAQEFVYLLNSAGPNIQVSRCAFIPGGCVGRLTTIDLAGGEELGTESLGLPTFDSVVATVDGRTLLWPIWGGRVDGFDRVTRETRVVLPASPESNVIDDLVLVRAPNQDIFYRIGNGAIDVFDLDGALGSIAITETSRRALAITADGARGYMLTTRGVGVIDLIGQVQASTIALPAGFRQSIAVAPDGSMVFVVSSGTDSPNPVTLYRIDPAASAIVGTRTLQSSGEIVVSRDGQYVWLAQGGSVRKLDAGTLTELARVALNGFAGGMTFSPDGARLLIATNTGLEVIDTALATATRRVARDPSSSLRPPVILPASAPCQFVATPRTVNAPVEGGGFSITVPAQTGCFWNVSRPDTDTWVRDVAPATGSGAGTIGFTLQFNSSSQPRIGSLLIAGQSIAIVQAAETIPPGVPDAPSGLTVDLTSGPTAIVRWTPGGGVPATGYLIEAGSASGDRDIASVLLGPATTLTAGPLANQRYYVRVKAVNGAGAGPASNEVVIDPFATPQAIINAQMRWHSPAEGVFSWDETIHSSVQFEIDVPSVAGSPSLPSFTARTRQLTVRREWLAPATYRVQIRGTNVIGETGPFMPFGPAFLLAACGSPPSAPSISTLEVNGPLVTLAMTAASRDPFDAFRIAVGRSPGASDVGIVDVVSSVVSAPLPSGQYYIRIATVNACGMSGSSEQTFIVP